MQRLRQPRIVGVRLGPGQHNLAEELRRLLRRLQPPPLLLRPVLLCAVVRNEGPGVVFPVGSPPRHACFASIGMMLSYMLVPVPRSLHHQLPELIPGVSIDPIGPLRSVRAGTMSTMGRAMRPLPSNGCVVRRAFFFKPDDELLHSSAKTGATGAL